MFGCKVTTNKKPIGRYSDGHLVSNHLVGPSQRRCSGPVNSVGDDYSVPLFAGKSIIEPCKFMPDIIQGVSYGIEARIAEGAVDMIVPGVMPSGCFLACLNMLEEDKDGCGARSGCVRQFSTFSWLCNARLKAMPEQLRAISTSMRGSCMAIITLQLSNSCLSLRSLTQACHSRSQD